MEWGRTVSSPFEGSIMMYISMEGMKRDTKTQRCKQTSSSIDNSLVAINLWGPSWFMNIIPLIKHSITLFITWPSTKSGSDHLVPAWCVEHLAWRALRRSLSQGMYPGSAHVWREWRKQNTAPSLKLQRFLSSSVSRTDFKWFQWWALTGWQDHPDDHIPASVS